MQAKSTEEVLRDALAAMTKAVEADGDPAFARLIRDARAALAMQASAPAPLEAEDLKQRIADIIREQHLTAVYHCTRVWDAWNVGTMSEQDFEAAAESALPEEIADSVLAILAASTKPAPTEPVPTGMTDVQQIAMALQRHGLSLLKTAAGYDVRRLGPIKAHIVSDLSNVRRAPDGGDKVFGAELRREFLAPTAAGSEALSLATFFHNTYERLAPSFGYETRLDTKTFDALSNNGRLMTAVCGEVLSSLAATPQVELSDEQILNLWSEMPKHHSIVQFARAILAARGKP